MADEFMKGFAILVTAGLGWLTLAGWYNTPGFEDAQLIGPNPPADALTTIDQFGIYLKEALLVFAIAGAIVFWVVIPGVRELRRSLSEQ